MGGGPRVVSPAVDWHERSSGVRAGKAHPEGRGFGVRHDSTGCLRLASTSVVARKGASTGVAFCSGSTHWAMKDSTSLVNSRAEDEKPVRCAAQTVHVTVNATAKPVHLLLRSSVALGFAKCTDRPKHMVCQGFLRQNTLCRKAVTSMSESSYRGGSLCKWLFLVYRMVI
jgi:hypothetical protein